MTKQSPPFRYISFILRCWTDGQGQLRARLIEAESGVSYPVADLEDLPALVRQLMARAASLEEDI